MTHSKASFLPFTMKLDELIKSNTEKLIEQKFGELQNQILLNGEYSKCVGDETTTNEVIAEKCEDLENLKNQKLDSFFKTIKIELEETKKACDSFWTKLNAKCLAQPEKNQIRIDFKDYLRDNRARFNSLLNEFLSDSPKHKDNFFWLKMNFNLKIVEEFENLYNSAENEIDNQTSNDDTTDNFDPSMIGSNKFDHSFDEHENSYSNS